MLLVPRSTKIYLGTAPVNLTKSYDGLCHEVREVLKQDPLSGHIFIFFNRRRTMAKLIVWTRGGLTLVGKRLERGTFSIPEVSGACVELDVHELALLLEGISFEGRRLSPRWEPPRHRRSLAGDSKSNLRST
ncbi:MAG: IS66 family insertion sequence element accessory protein TnpB [Myxococcota bacterium]